MESTASKMLSVQESSITTPRDSSGTNHWGRPVTSSHTYSRLSNNEKPLLLMSGSSRTTAGSTADPSIVTDEKISETRHSEEARSATLNSTVEDTINNGSKPMPSDCGPPRSPNSQAKSRTKSELVMPTRLGVDSYTPLLTNSGRPTSYSHTRPDSKLNHHAPKASYTAMKSLSLSSSSSSIPSTQGREAPVRSYTSEPDYHAVKLAADCLHAQDYSRMIMALSKETPTIAVLFGCGLAHYKLRKYKDAVKNFTEMDQLASMNLSENGNIYLSQYYLGEISFTQNQHQKAAQHYRKASRAYTTESVAKRYRIVQTSLATIYSKQGSALRQAQKIMEAVKAYKEALKVASTKKDKLAAFTSLGNLYQSLGENASALVQYEHTITLSEELGDFISLGWAHGNLGNAYLGLHQKQKALKHLEKSLQLTIDHEPTPQAIGRAYNNLGTAYQSLNELEKAKEYYDLALNQAIYGIDLGGQARVYGNYGNVLMIQKKYEPAISHYTEALSISKDRSTRSTAHHNRGCAYYEKAEIDKKEILGVGKPSGDDEFYITYHDPEAKEKPLSKVYTKSVREKYSNGCNDLTEVVQYHEETFQTIKGSAQGLSLSVSLFETNSRTFHRLQDCLFNLGEWDNALEVAEQSRARTLGELLLQRKTGQLEMELTSPLKLDQIGAILKTVDTCVVFISYTGARLLAWVFIPQQGKITTERFQVALEDDQFDGKSLDYYLRYSLADELIENTVEMYSECTYYQSPPLTKLYHLFGKPLLEILTKFGPPFHRDVVLIPDSYTNLMPVTSLLNNASHQFLGDKFCFRTMPSLLTLGILGQLPEVVVRVPEESHNFCVVGNPSVPTFKYQGETWNLGKLPYATEEAEKIAHILKCSPTLHEQATKSVVQSMISVAKIIHLATHGSATAGFLAFAGLGSSRSRSVSDEKLVLLYPEEIEKINISPALVVLSSCDSGRGTVKADGIQGMARAFILAGAQAVLTTLWRVPDESAAVFMQFFYQYMMDGFKGSHALQKAILSIRSFKKYSRYIHWSGYQLSGREIQFVVAESLTGEALLKEIGPCAVFPQLEVVKKLEKVFIKDAYCPSDVQIIHGFHGLRPFEPVVEFITQSHSYFTGGIFFISAVNEHFAIGAEKIIKEHLRRSSLSPSLSESKAPILLIFDNLIDLPSESSFFHSLLRRDHTHVITLLNKDISLETFKKKVDNKLLRGTNMIELRPLSELHSSQRIVHCIAKRCDFAPYNKEQEIIANLAEMTRGSPDLLEVTCALLAKYIDRYGDEMRFLEEFNNDICSKTQAEKDRELESEYDNSAAIDFTCRLLKGFDLSEQDYFFLSTLSLFGASPIPRCIVERIQSLAVAASPGASKDLSPLASLTSAKLLNVCPSPIIFPSQGHHHQTQTSKNNQTLLYTESEFYSVPQIVGDAVRHFMDEEDLMFSITAAYRSLKQFHEEQNRKGGPLFPFMAGLSLNLLQGQNEECYEELYRTYLLFAAS